MRPDRWQEVERLYHAALERDPEIRAAFLGEVSANSANHEDVVNEVQSLLEQRSNDSRFERPIWEIKEDSRHRRFAVGMQLGSYKIEALLGAGGMGEVSVRATQA